MAKDKGRVAAKARPKRRRRLVVRILQWTLISFLAGVVLAVGAFIAAYIMIDIPKADEMAQAETTSVYYADGKTLMGKFSLYNRDIIDTKTLPDYVGKAVVASENRTFYQDSGIDLKSIARALINNIKGGPRQGASTLTQQYVERYYMGETTGYLGKAKEAILALKINRSQSKEEILSNYLNTIYFGRGAYGIQSASRAFFGKDAPDLTLSEAAMLAGIIPAPTAWDPVKDPVKAQERWSRVLDLMQQDGYITLEERAAQVFPPTVEQPVSELYAGTQGYLLQEVRKELQNRAGMTEEQIDTGGYKIISTIQKDKQDMAVEAANSMPDSKAPNLRVALVSVDTATGGIIAEYGGADYLQIQSNAATDDVSQAGSTFKPFTLLAALEAGHTLSDSYSGQSPMTIDGYKLSNFGRVSYGRVNMIASTANSINTSYVQLNRDIGPKKTKETAVKAGIPADTVGLNEDINNVLGTCSPHTVDLATAFTTIANKGKFRPTHIIGQVLDRTGDVIYSGEDAAREVFDADAVADVTYAMEQVVQVGSGKEARALGRPVAAKTGTSENNKSAQFVGFVPQMVTVVSLYQVGADGSEEPITPFGGYREITGSTWPSKVWTTYMKKAVTGLPIEKFPGRTKKSYTSSTAAPPAQRTEEPTETPAPTDPANPAPQPTQPSGTAPSPQPTPSATQPANPAPQPTQPGGQPSSPGQQPGGQPGGQPQPAPTQPELP